MPTAETDSKLPDFSSRLETTLSTIDSLCLRYGRAPESVHLLAVSKTKPLHMIEQAYQQGITHFGENYLQEALEKVSHTTALALTWHFIGSIQSNKTRQIATNFRWVHTVSSLKIARRLSEQKRSEQAPINVCIQVNVSEDPAKSGVMPDQLNNLVSTMLPLDGILLRGLMAVPRASNDLAGQRRPFRQLRELRDQVADRFQLPQFTELSMGMSADLEAAIAEGATWVRLGTAIFGQREVAAPGLSNLSDTQQNLGEQS